MDAQTLPSRHTMYRAFMSRDSQFEGLFYTGVKTTGIFCRPTCTAKKPKMENVVFFRSTKEALDNGYRPCKVCRPMHPAGSVPDWVAQLLSRIASTDDHVLKDCQLREMGLDPARVRRWFNRHHGMTFLAHARQLRINKAYGAIKSDFTVIDSAYDSGYESLSGFSDAFKKTTGFVPSAATRRNIVTVARLTTPLGPMVAGIIGDELCLLEFADRPMLETQLKRTKSDFHGEIVVGEHPLFGTVQGQLDAYFNGSRTAFDLPLASYGSDFQKAVWRTLVSIPYGATRTYSQQAASIGKPGAVRAVGRANGDNRIAIVIPCHRVVGTDGTLTGYGGGLWRKRYLLDLERAS